MLSFVPTELLAGTWIASKTSAIGYTLQKSYTSLSTMIILGSSSVGCTVFLLTLAIFCESGSVMFRKTLQKRTSCRFLCHSSLRMCKQEATVGMGCFWGPQEKFDKMPGVVGSKAGYSGGENTNPTYKTVCSGDGHVEAVRIQYEDSEISYDQILDAFFDRDLASFGNGLGQYQSVIWTENAEQKDKADKRLQKLSLDNDPRAKLVSIREKETFHIAETYHQKYNEKQFPRYVVLAVAALLDVLPGLPQEAYKLGLVLTLGYVAITVGERFIDGSGSLEKI